MKEKYNRSAWSYKVKMWFYRLDKNDMRNFGNVLGECAAGLGIFCFIVMIILLLG